MTKSKMYYFTYTRRRKKPFCEFSEFIEKPLHEREGADSVPSNGSTIKWNVRACGNDSV